MVPNACSISASTLRQTIVAKHNYRLERMCQTFQVLFLFSTQIHRIFLLTLGLKTGHSTAISHISPNYRVDFYAVKYDEPEREC